MERRRGRGRDDYFEALVSEAAHRLPGFGKRLDESFGFERHFTRGLDRMRLKMDLALIVMLAMAVGRIDENDADNLRSLVAAA